MVLGDEREGRYCFGPSTLYEARTRPVDFPKILKRSKLFYRGQLDSVASGIRQRLEPWSLVERGEFS